jgi:hypothetical protein
MRGKWGLIRRLTGVSLRSNAVNRVAGEHSPSSAANIEYRGRK